jgi:transcriptional regulator with XRE-family HTH domain
MNPAPKSPDLSTYSGRFAARLRALREKSGLSVEQVVARIEVANKSDRSSPKVQSYYGWEQGKSTPHMDLFPAIAKVFKVAVYDILPEK